MSHKNRLNLDWTRRKYNNHNQVLGKAKVLLQGMEFQSVGLLLISRLQELRQIFQSIKIKEAYLKHRMKPCQKKARF